MELNFKLFEMTHLMPRTNGIPQPFYYDGSYVELLDMKFENYPKDAPERYLPTSRGKFYGQFPKENRFLVWDGKELSVSSHEPVDDDYFKIRNDWLDYALFVYTDGSVKQPVKSS